MEVEIKDFPVELFNTRNGVRVVGRLRFPPLGTLSINYRQYLVNKEQIDLRLSLGDLQIVEPIEEAKYLEDTISAEVIGGYLGQNDTIAAEVIDTNDITLPKEKSLVARFKDKEITWQQALKEIEGITDPITLADLYEEALELGIKSDGVVVKALLSAIEGNS